MPRLHSNRLATMSLHSTIIQACMSNIHKEISQLEHWLIRLPQEATPQPANTSLQAMVERLSKQMEVQQHTLNHIIDRLDILENRPESDAFMGDPWLDHAGTQLQNEIVDVLEPIYTVRKESAAVAVMKEPTHVAIDPMPMIQVTGGTDILMKETLPEAAPEAVPEAAPEAVPIKETAQVVPEAVPEAQVVIPIPDGPEHAIEIPEEEEGVELETITFKGTDYYKDEEGFIYRIDEDDQPSETAVGYWKEKSKSITFYRT